VLRYLYSQLRLWRERLTRPITAPRDTFCPFNSEITWQQPLFFLSIFSSHRDLSFGM